MSTLMVVRTGGEVLPSSDVISYRAQPLDPEQGRWFGIPTVILWLVNISTPLSLTQEYKINYRV